jgi:hypothetical protein
MSFAVAKDAVHTTAAAGYVVGSGSLTVAAGTGAQFPTPTPSAPILFTVVSAATYGLFPETFCTYEATGLTGDTLTGITLIDGTDTAWVAGADVEMRTCAKHLNDLAAGIAAGGGSTITEVAQTTSFTAAAGSFYAISGSGAVTATLPTAVGIAGQMVRIRCVNGYTGLCTITGTGGQTIGGQATRIIFAGESPLLQSDGSNWVRTGGTVVPCSCKMTNSSNQPVPSDGAQHLLALDTLIYDNTGRMGDTTSKGITLLRPGNYSALITISSPVTSATNLVMWGEAYTTGASGIYGLGTRQYYSSLATGFGISASFQHFIVGGAASDFITIKVFQNNADNVTQTLDASNNCLDVEELLAW